MHTKADVVWTISKYVDVLGESIKVKCDHW
jgi:hypothetical protein